MTKMEKLENHGIKCPCDDGKRWTFLGKFINNDITYYYYYLMGQSNSITSLRTITCYWIWYCHCWEKF